MTKHFMDNPRRCLDQFWGAWFIPGYEEDHFDPAMVLDYMIAQFRAGDTLHYLHRHLHWLVDRTPDESSAEANLYEWLEQAGLPDGPISWHEYMLASVERVDQAVADPLLYLPPLPDGDGMRIPRTSKFASQEMADAACTQVVRRSKPALEAWLATPSGWARQHLYLDLASEMGTVGTVLTAAEPRGSSLPVGQDATVSATGVVVVMARDPGSSNPYVLTAYPELALDEDVRARYPNLCHWFGGFFNQDGGLPDSAMREACALTTGPASAAVRAELQSLYDADLGEEGTRAVLEHLGSYVLPTYARHWVDRTNWRLGAFDWSKAVRWP